MTKARAWILAVLLILAWTAIPDGPEATASECTVRYVEGLDGAPLAQCYAGDTLLTDIESPDLPRCTEDAVLVGIGDFDNGRWTEYTCGPAVDDYEEDDHR